MVHGVGSPFTYDPSRYDYDREFPSLEATRKSPAPEKQPQRDDVENIPNNVDRSAEYITVGGNYVSARRQLSEADEAKIACVEQKFLESPTARRLKETWAVGQFPGD